MLRLAPAAFEEEVRPFWASGNSKERSRHRKLLGANKGSGAPTDKQLALYDISDCADPKLLADVEVADHIGCAGDLAPDRRR